MNNRKLDRLVRDAQPGAGLRLPSERLGRAKQDLLEAIMSSPVTSELDSSGEHLPRIESLPPQRSRRGRRTLLAIAAAAAVAAAVAVPTLALRGSGGNISAPVVPAIQTPAVAPLSAGNPGLLIEDPGWTVDHVDESMPGEGEIRWVHGDDDLQVNWRSASSYQGYYEDRLRVSPPEPVTVLGRPGALFTYSGTDFAVMLPVKGASFLELRGTGGDRAAFLALLATLKQVPAAQWYAAMPESIVTPAKEAEVAAAMLEGVPLPPGFKASALMAGQTNDRYQFGAKVLGAVACGWIKNYSAARAAGDTEGMSRVSAALSTSADWKISKELGQGGAYAGVVASIAEKVAKGQDVTADEDGLGCS